MINGYEWTETRSRDYLATRPYYIYQLQLMVPRGSPVRSWGDLKRPRPEADAGPSECWWDRPPRLTRRAGGRERRGCPAFDGSTDAMTAVQNGQYDVTLQDLPAARFYARAIPRPGVAVGPPESHGYYVIYVQQAGRSAPRRPGPGPGRLIASGELRRLYERYGIWTEAKPNCRPSRAPSSG